MTDASDGNFFPSASSEKELGLGCWEVPGMRLASCNDLPMALRLTKIIVLAIVQHFYWGCPPPCPSPHWFSCLFSWLWISFCSESPAQWNCCSATEEAQEIHMHVRSCAVRMRISPLPLPVRSPMARAKPCLFPAEPRGLSPYPARWMQPVGANSSLFSSCTLCVGKPPTEWPQPCTAATGSAIEPSPSQWHKLKLWFPAWACSPSRDRCVLQHLAVCLPLF